MPAGGGGSDQQAGAAPEEGRLRRHGHENAKVVAAIAEMTKKGKARGPGGNKRTVRAAALPPRLPGHLGAAGLPPPGYLVASSSYFLSSSLVPTNRMPSGTCQAG